MTNSLLIGIIYDNREEQCRWLASQAVAYMRLACSGMARRLTCDDTLRGILSKEPRIFGMKVMQTMILEKRS